VYVIKSIPSASNDTSIHRFAINGLLLPPVIPSLRRAQIPSAKNLHCNQELMRSSTSLLFPTPLLMPPRVRLTTNSTPEAIMAAQDLGASEWERSKISNQDVNLMKNLGLMKKKEALIFPSEESYPSPPSDIRLALLTTLFAASLLLSMIFFVDCSLCTGCSYIS
jgi:hypothetical protein